MKSPQKIFNLALKRIVDSDLFVHCPKTNKAIMLIINKKSKTVFEFFNWLEESSLNEFEDFIISCGFIKVAGMNSQEWLNYCQKFKGR